ncbi:hypothetical protein Y1Q_0000125 [Alligator mississippiensis]|uniref:Uncharacterized protein n=1 Tax=Alligator mississippiensis TaxID=8496 RepID=A0A151NR59_ALLMI|nr:hypothetical protein Y1Q_0000125 [Alligator mississippiensis]
MAPQADVKHIFIFAVSLRPTNKYSLPDDAALILNRIQDCSCKRKSISLFQLMSCIFLGDLPSMYWRSCQMSVGPWMYANENEEKSEVQRKHNSLEKI